MTKRGTLQLDDTKEGDTLVASISGDVDLHCWSQLEEWSDRLQSHGGPVVLDASAITFCDSIMLRFLLRLRERVPHFSLREPSPDLRVVLESAGLMEAFHLEA